MTSEFVKHGLVVGGFTMPTILPRADIGDRLSLRCTGTSEWPSRISVYMKDGQFAGHINLTLAEEIFPLVTRITEMWGVAKQISSRRNPGWDVEVHFKLAIE